MDLTKQKTFTGNSILGFWGSEDNFILRNHKDIDFKTLWMFDENTKSWQYCCRVDTLKELEKEYNKRSSNVFDGNSF